MPRSPKPAYFLCFVVVGVSMAMSGPALTHLRHQVGASVAQGGLILAAQAVGYVLASLTVGGFLDRGAGHRLILAAGAVAVASIAAIPAMGNLPAMVGLFVVLGACGGIIDVSCNTLLVWSEPPTTIGSSLNALHLCFGLGAIASPLVVAASLRARDDLAGVALTVAALLVAIAVLMRTRPAALPRLAPTLPDEGAAPGAAAQASAHRRRVLVAAAVFFAFYVAAEGTFASWVATYGEDLDLRLASGPALLTAVFWVGFSLGRVATVVATRRMRVEPILVATCGAAAVVALALWASDGAVALAWVLTGLLGVALGPQYASMLAAADHRIRLDGSSTSVLVGIAGVGGLFGPLVTGVVLEHHGVGMLPAVVAVPVVVAGVAAAVAVRVPEHRDVASLRVVASPGPGLDAELGPPMG